MALHVSLYFITKNVLLSQHKLRATDEQTDGRTTYGSNTALDLHYTCVARQQFAYYCVCCLL